MLHGLLRQVQRADVRLLRAEADLDLRTVTPHDVAKDLADAGAVGEDAATENDLNRPRRNPETAHDYLCGPRQAGSGGGQHLGGQRVTL